MKSIQIEIPKDFIEMIESVSKIGTEIFSNTDVTLRNLAKYSQNVLSRYVAGTRELDGIGFIDKPFSPQKIYFDIKKQSELRYKLTASSKELSELQNGRAEIPEYDMKKTSPYGKKSRKFSNGTPYLIIPFRWGTPNENNKKRAHFNNYIPQADYETNVKPMAKTFIANYKKQEANASGVMIDRAVYQDKKDNPGFAARIKDGEVQSPISKWSGLHYSAGMVRMMSNGKSTYWSFRIITPYQPKDMWVRKAKPAKQAIDIESAWARSVQDHVMSTVEKALKQDLGL